MLGVTLITFYLSYGMGDPLAAHVTERTTDEQYEMLAEKHGINDPIYIDVNNNNFYWTKTER